MTRPLLVVLRALKLGDYLTGLPALRALRDAFPDHRCVLAAPGWLAPLVHHVGAVDELAPTQELAPLDRRLQHPALAVDLHGRGPGSQPLLVALRPDRLIAFAHPDIPETAGQPRWRPGEHEVDRWCRLLNENGIAADRSRLAIDPAAIAMTDPARGATVIHPGAASAARRWPIERFAAVAREELAAGRTVVVTGNEGEMSRAARLTALAGGGRVRNLAGRTDLLTLTAVVGHAGRVVCGDTGVGHLATALGTPSVVLFGPVPPAEWGPPPDPKHQALWAGRRGDPHGRTVHSGLLDITVADVRAALGRLPARCGDPPGSLGPAPGGDRRQHGFGFSRGGT